MAIIISLDIGTSTLSALAYALDPPHALTVRTCPNTCDVPGVPAPGHEQDPGCLLARCLDLIQSAAVDERVQADQVVGIGITGQMHGLLLVDQQARPQTNLFTWRDARALPSDSFPDLASACERTGCRLRAGYGGLTLRRCLRAGGLRANALQALSIADYLAAALTGVLATEPTQAASWGILDLRGRTWDGPSLRALGIPESVLPPIRPSALPLGVLLPEAATRLGLPAGIRVCSPLGDNQASFIGAASSAADSAVLNLGTGGQISVPVATWAKRPGLETRPLPFGGYILVGASLCGGWAYAYLRRFFQAVVRDFTDSEIEDAEAYRRMNVLASRALPGAAGLAADTRFSGTRDQPTRRGGLHGIDARNLTPPNLCRAVVEGMVRELADTYANARAPAISRILISGNAARRNPLVREVVEAAFGLPCSVAEIEEEAALGAARAAAVGLGLAPIETVCVPGR